jgi:hypothetical protein
MANATVLADRRQSFLRRVLDLEHRTKTELARLVLTATALTVQAGLLTWLLCWIGLPEGVVGAFVAHGGLTEPVIAFQASDLERLTAPARDDARRRGPAEGARPAVPAETGKTPPAPVPVPTARARLVKETASTNLLPRLRALLAQAGSRPVLFYLSAPGVSVQGDSPGGRAYLLPSPVAPLSAVVPTDAVTVQALLDLCKAYPNARKLLILDAGQVGSDRNLGVFANGFAWRLKQAMAEQKPRNLAVLTSTAPGQVSWASEADGCSVFAHYVARGLAGHAEGWDPAGRGAKGRGVTVQGLAWYVRCHVGLWVWQHRQAVQTPELLCEPDVNFTLRKLPRTRERPLTAGPDDPAVVDRLLKLLETHWTRRDALAAREPWGRAPLLWQRYLETALRAERLIRNAEAAEAEQILSSLDSLEATLEEAIRPAAIRYPSRAMALACEAPQSSLLREIAASEQADDERLKGLIPADAPDQAPPPVEGPGGPAAPGGAAPAGAGDKPAAVEAADKPMAGPVAKPSAPVASRKAGARPKARGAGGEEVVPEYAEQQPIAWVEAYLDNKVAPDFGGGLGEPIRKAVLARRRAEQAAAPDAGILGWITPLVEDGDRRRREATDRLFILGGESMREADQQLDLAAASYDVALQDAELYRRAFHLVRRVQAELPYYGEWAVRVQNRPKGSDPGFGERLQKLLEGAVALAERVSAPPGDKGDAPAARMKRIEDLKTRLDAVSGGFEELTGQFKTEWGRRADPTTPAGWVELDDVLCVPLIPAQARLRLLNRVRSRPVAGSLAEEDTPDQPVPGPDTPSLPSELPATDATTPSPSAADSSGSPTRVDLALSPPDLVFFWSRALGLARLEQGLLALGNAAVGRLEDDLKRQAVALPWPLRFDEFENHSATIRTLRLRQIEQVELARTAQSEKDDAKIEQLLVPADRAARCLPLADARSLQALGTSGPGEPGPAQLLDRFRLASLLRWQGERLLQDFAPRNARRVLDEARKLWPETNALAGAGEKAQAMELARLTIQAVPADGLKLDDWTNQPLTGRIEVVGDVPPGLAAALVDRDPYDADLAVTVSDTRHDARDGVGVLVEPSNPRREVQYLVARTRPESSRAQLRPSTFYRGRTFRVATPLEVALGAVKEPIAISLCTARQGLLARARLFGLPDVPRDQFLEHPNDGYLHFDARLDYEVLIKNNTEKPLNLDVRIDDQAPGNKPLHLDPGDEGSFPGTAWGAPALLDKPKALVVTVAEREGRVTDRNGKNNLTVRREFLFHVIRSKDYLASTGWIVPGPDSNVVYVTINHLSGDLITWPTHVSVSAPGVPFPAGVRHIPRGASYTFFAHVPVDLQQVPISVNVEHEPPINVQAAVPAPPPPRPAAEAPKL